MFCFKKRKNPEDNRRNLSNFSLFNWGSKSKKNSFMDSDSNFGFHENYYKNNEDYADKIKAILLEDEEETDPEFLLTRHFLFIQLDILCLFGEKDFGWKEISRWLKFEEKVEAVDRWSKPHVSTISLRSLLKFQKIIENDKFLFLLDMETINFTWKDLIRNIISEAGNFFSLSLKSQNLLKYVITAPHKHKERMGVNNKPFKEVFSSVFSRKISLFSKDERETWNKIATYPKNVTPSNLGPYYPNKKLQSKLPKNSETACIWTGCIDFAHKPINIFIRFKNPILIYSTSEVEIPTRFLVISLEQGDGFCQWQQYEFGRAIGVLLNDKIFCEVAFKFSKNSEILLGIREFIDDLTVLPPSIWDPSIYLQPPNNTMTIQKISERLNRGERLYTHPEKLSLDEDTKSEFRNSGRLFRDFLNDIRRKKKFYISDFKDGFNLQCLATIIFLYFACITPIVTFGGLFSSKTDSMIGTIEMLVSGSICGISFGLFSGQPLIIVGATGPLLVYESIVYEICKVNGFDFLQFRFWMGFWVFIYLLIITITGLSSLVKLITRFTEESFSVLISIIFVYEAITKLSDLWNNSQIHTDVIREPRNYYCTCQLEKSLLDPSSSYFLKDKCWTRTGNLTVSKLCINSRECLENNGTLVGSGCVPAVTNSLPDVFLFSCILLFGTFGSAFTFKFFRKSSFFPNFIRTFLSDFAVLIAVIIWTTIDYHCGLNTEKLHVPDTFRNTVKTRSWFVYPFHIKPWWLGLLAMVPATLATILIFLDQQITAVIVNRKENKLVKGAGYHLDIFILSFLILICSLFGLPWFCAATVRSINHVNSLVKLSDNSHPGEVPTRIGTIEQRVTGILIHILIGLSVFGAYLLQVIPMAVLYGVIFFMGISSLTGVQYIDRILLIFQPIKYQPDFVYLRHVKSSHVHAFTFIQIICSAIMWMVKSFNLISIIFPLMLVLLVVVRQILDKIFTQHDLYWLDSLLPETKRRKKEDRQKALDFASFSREKRRFSGRKVENLFSRNLVSPINQDENTEKPEDNSTKVTPF